MRELSGLTALVTGASRGIGVHIARALAREKMQLALAARSAAELNALAAELSGQGVRAQAFVADVAAPESAAELVERVGRELGPVDLLVNNAGIEQSSAFHETPIADLERMIAINLVAPMRLSRLVLPGMLERRRGHVVCIASLAGKFGPAFQVAYGASKAGTTNLTRVAALEFGGDNIRVNAVLPGGTATEGAKEATEAMKKSGIELKGPMTLPGRIPLGGMGSPDDIAAACLFLVSPAARYITGQCLAVDGGFLVS